MNLTESRHPSLSWIAHDLARWVAAYQGFKDYVSVALQTHPKENAADFRERHKRTPYFNYVRPICDTYGNYIFRPEWEITAPDALKFLIDDADRMGTRFTDFFKAICPLVTVAGYGFVGVDSPATVEPLRNRAEQMSRNVRPYLYWVSPADFVDWAVDEDGKLRAALVKEKAAHLRNIGDDAVGERFRLWTADEWQLLDADGNTVESGPNPARRVPFVPVKFRDSGDPVSAYGLGQDLEPIQAHILNLCSLLAEIFYRQTFSQLVAPGHPEEFNADGDLAKIGTSTIFTFDPESSHAPHFISPDAAQAGVLISDIDRSIDEMYRIANLSRGTAREATAQSGVSKAFDFLDSNQAFTDVARNFATAMEGALEIAAAWQGIANPEITVTPPADFGVVDLDGDVQRYALLSQANASPALLAALQKRIGKTIAPRDDDIGDLIDQEATRPRPMATWDTSGEAFQ